MFDISSKLMVELYGKKNRLNIPFESSSKIIKFINEKKMGESRERRVKAGEERGKKMAIISLSFFLCMYFPLTINFTNKVHEIRRVRFHKSTLCTCFTNAHK